jgi:hypothetical protein
METCTVETGLLKKKPCGHNGVTRCSTCEQPLCKQHIVPQKTAGKFMCKECDAARREFEKSSTTPRPMRITAAASKAPKEATKPAPVQAKADHGGALEFTPSTDKK